MIATDRNPDDPGALDLEPWGDPLRAPACSVCDDTGFYVVRHPRWGSLTCPTPEIEIVCDCGGGGPDDAA